MVGRQFEWRRRRMLLVATIASALITGIGGAVFFHQHPYVETVKIPAIDCSQASQLIERIGQGDADENDRQQVRTHLQCCPRCQKRHHPCCPSYHRAFNK